MSKPILHKHLIIRAECEKQPESKDYLKQWFRDLIVKIDMKLLSGPHVEYVEVEGNRGYTGVCIIETSHLAVHTWDEYSPVLIQLDVYSCSSFDIDTVFKHLEVFSPVKIGYKFLDREHELKLLQES